MASIANMWNFKPSRVRDYFRYQRLNTASDSGDTDGEPFPSPSALSHVEDGKEYEKHQRPNGASICLLGFSALVFIVSLFYYLRKRMNYVNDRSCMYRMSAPSMCFHRLANKKRLTRLFRPCP